MANQQEIKTAKFESDFAKARKTGKRIKKETIGGVVHETWEQPDGRTWIFAYYTEKRWTKPRRAEKSK